MSRLAKYFPPDPEPHFYRDKLFKGTDEEYIELLKNSTTLYVSSLNQAISEERIWELFSLVGTIKRVIMGINRKDLCPCGFFFIEYYNRADTEKALSFFNGFKLDGRFMKCNYDYGFEPGREFGRGEKGGQVKDDYAVKKFRYFNHNERR